METMERVLTGFLRQILGVPANTSSKLFVCRVWQAATALHVAQAVPYLSAKVLKMDRTCNCSCRAAFDTDVLRGLSWYHGLAQQLRQQYDIQLPRLDQQHHLTRITRLIHDKDISQIMSPEPDNHSQQTYYSCKTEYRMEPYISQAKNRHARAIIARFRLGKHWL